MTLYNTMPKGFGCVNACVKIGQHEYKDGSRKYQLHSEDKVWDWWTPEVSTAINSLAECFRMCPFPTKFGETMEFDERDLEGEVLDVELNVSVTKITNWVFLVAVVNSKCVAKEEAEDPVV